MPAHITAEMSIPERLKLYSAGGCLFVTTRILVHRRIGSFSVCCLFVVYSEGKDLSVGVCDEASH